MRDDSETEVRLRTLSGILAASDAATTGSDLAPAHDLLAAALRAGICELRGEDAEDLPSDSATPTLLAIRLYLDWRGHQRGAADREKWADHVSRVRGGLVESDEATRRLNRFLTRSRWLRTSHPSVPAPPGLRPALERVVAAAEADCTLVTAAAAQVQGMVGLYEYERHVAHRRFLDAAMRQPEVLAAVCALTLDASRYLRIHEHRLRLLVDCLSHLENGDMIGACVAEIRRTMLSVGSMEASSITNLFTNAFDSLQRMNRPDDVRSIVDDVEKGTAPQVPGIMASAARGAFLLGELDRAKALLAPVTAQVLDASAKHAARFAAAESLVAALSVAPLAVRCAKLALLGAVLAQLTDPHKSASAHPADSTVLIEAVVDALLC